MSPKAKREFHIMMHFMLFVLLFSMGKFMLYDPYIKKNMDVKSYSLTASAENSLVQNLKLENQKITIVAVGDVMMHQSELDAGYDTNTDTYNFSNIFSYINPYLKGDIVYANLETPIAGKELKYSGYPTFNAPTELLSALKESNFTHLSLANNHSLDRGVKGLSNTIDNVNMMQMIGMGARKNKDQENFVVTEINGFKVGLLAYTYGTNGLSLNSDDSYMLSNINKEEIANDITQLKKQNVDLIVTAFHFGEEYKLVANEYQEDISEFACIAGANIVLGSHPHVLEPIKYINEGKCLVAYSLGNFISSMSKPYTDLGGILKIEITKENSEINLKPEFMGTWVRRNVNERGVRDYQIIPLDIDKIPKDINITKAESERISEYRDFVDIKIKAYLPK